MEGLKILLKPDGVLTLEFPHLLRLIERNEFDTIYHEHFSYFSLLTTVRILEAHGLKCSMLKSCLRTAARFAFTLVGQRIDTHPVVPASRS